jgi:hypothetical protein
MVTESVGCVCVMILLKIWMMLCMLLLVCILVLKVVHHLHPSSPSGSSVDTAMLPLVSLVKHAVKVLRRGMRVRRSRRRWRIGIESGSNVIGWGGIAGYLVSWMMRLGVLWVIVVPSALLWESVTIGHLIPPQTDQAAALAQRCEHRPWRSMLIPGVGLGR